MSNVTKAHNALCDLHVPYYQHEVPTVNLNGTSKDSLLGDYLAIRNALNAAEMAFREATPHGRDYQTVPAGDAKASRAREAFHERRAILRAMAAEIEAVAIAINEQEGR